MQIDTNANGFEWFPNLIDQYDIEPDHIIHVGAHQGQEVPFYIQAGFTYITLVEPNPKLAQYLRQRYNIQFVINNNLDRITIHEAACSNRDDEYVTLKLMPQSKMSTIARDVHPHDKVIDTITVPNIQLRNIARDANVAVIDVQGMELDVLKSGDLNQFDLIVVQTSTIDDPTIAPSHQSVVEYMKNNNFTEIPNWTKDRSYDVIDKWSRGNYGQRKTGGKVFDSTFVRTK